MGTPRRVDRELTAMLAPTIKAPIRNRLLTVVLSNVITLGKVLRPARILS